MVTGAEGWADSGARKRTRRPPRDRGSRGDGERFRMASAAVDVESSECFLAVADGNDDDADHGTILSGHQYSRNLHIAPVFSVPGNDFQMRITRS